MNRWSWILLFLAASLAGCSALAVIATVERAEWLQDPISYAVVTFIGAAIAAYDLLLELTQ